jgi:hypothetical protein
LSKPQPKSKQKKSPAKKTAQFDKPLKFARVLESGTKRFIITAAQNATPVHSEFFEALKVAANELEAELIIIPLRYKNPTSRWTESQENQEIWADETLPYIFNARKKLCDNLVLAGDIKTQPTASSPLTGFEGLTGGESCIIGHTKVQLKVIPVPSGKFPKILTTTGSCTVPNYTDSKAGKLGAFHHSLAAVIVEVKGKRFHLRQLCATKDGSFIDLDKAYSYKGVTKAPRALGLAMGDSHARFMDSKVEKATFGPGGIVETLDPEHLIWHDVLDAYSINHHHAGNPFIGYAKKQSGLGDIQKEVEFTIAMLDRYTGLRKSVIVPSNHDDMLSRWIISDDWKRNPTNSKFYLETALAMLESVNMTPNGTEYRDPFEYWVGKLSKNPRVRCLKNDESFTLAGIECGMHGHQGPNGSRGSVKNLSNLGVCVVSGHGHSPAITDGHYRAGTSTPLKLEYTKGPSSWLNTHVAIYGNGKRSLITIIDGEWRLSKTKT